MVDKEIFEGFSTLENTSEDSLIYTSGDEALILKIELGNKIEELIVYEAEPPEEAVKKFCVKHKLTQAIETALIAKVVENLKPEDLVKPVNQPRFIKKGNFIKKEADRGRSAFANTNRSFAYSPEKLNPKEEKKYGQSPDSRNKSRTIHFHNTSNSSLKPSTKQKSNRM